MRYVLGIIGFILFIVFIIVFFARIGGRSSTPSATLEASPALLASAGPGTTFTYIEQGPIVSEEKRVEIRIIVSANSRRVEFIRGYEYTVLAQENLGNNQNAFNDFVSSLDRQGYTFERETSFDSEQGICSGGKRYIFESNQNDEHFRRWTTSCEEKGTFGGNLAGVVNLFRRQIPEYDKFMLDARTKTGLTI